MLGTQTIKLIQKNIQAGCIDSIEYFILDAYVIDDLSKNPNSQKVKQLEKELISRWNKQTDNPTFKELSDRLEDLRNKAERGLIASIDFVKELCKLAQETVHAERETEPVAVRKTGAAALTKLFLEIKTDQTPAVVERIVTHIDQIVKVVRFPGWQTTASAEREGQKSHRQSLLKYKLHKDQQLFDRAYGYFKEYY